MMRPLTKLHGDLKSVGIKIFKLINKICFDREWIYLPSW